MLIILTTHPIQYQVPLWQALARDGSVPFEVWYLSDHASRRSHDVEFRTQFAWDIDMLSGYVHRFLKAPADVHPASFWKCRASESLSERLKACGATALWIQGWQVAGYWQAVWAARRAGCAVWLRGESNDLAPVAGWKQAVKKLILGMLFRRVDQFLCIGTANRRLYRKFGVPESRLHSAPYAVDNERFAAQAEKGRGQRTEIRQRWGIADDAFCLLFCGKFIPKKRPADLVAAAVQLARTVPAVHLLFVGSGELGSQLRKATRVVFDAETRDTQHSTLNTQHPPASFAGFLNQTEISRAYVAADCLVLPSDYGETWGLVVNEAMASGLPCVISDRCGCAEDLGVIPLNQTFPFGDTAALADRLARLGAKPRVSAEALDEFSFSRSVRTVNKLHQGEGARAPLAATRSEGAGTP